MLEGLQARALGKIDAIAIVRPPPSKDLYYVKSFALHTWLLGYMFDVMHIELSIYIFGYLYIYLGIYIYVYLISCIYPYFYMYIYSNMHTPHYLLPTKMVYYTTKI